MASFNKNRQKWVASSRWHGPVVYLGYYSTQSEAVQAEENARRIWDAYDEWEASFVLSG